MIRFLDTKSKNYQTKLINFLDLRRSGKNIDTTIVKKILKDVKLNKNKALLKYEKKFSNNTKIKPTKNEINNSIKTLDPKIKNAIDFAYSRILKFHSLQKTKNINQSNGDLILELFAIDIFKKKENFEIVLLFSKNGIITLSTEAIDVTLEDQKN